MDINYYKKYEPIFGSWNIVRMIGEGSFGQVYEIERNELGTTYKAALKTITIPQSQSELNSVKADGMTDDEVTSYYEGVVQDIINEFVLMAQMKGTSHIVSYEDHQIIKHEEGIGWDILIRMELLTPIFEHLKEKEYTAADVAKMGIDLCKSLELCQKHSIVHRDVKPENIFISPNGDYKLGDFGIARTVEKTTSGLSRKGTFLYMAPEVYLGKAYGATVDIYSLGLVMYRLLNDNRMPFFPEYPKPITHTDRENALIERISGAQLPKPSKAADDLAQIILKACEFDPEKRYRTASEMRKELEMTLKEMEKETTAENSVSISDEFAKALEEEQVKGTDMIEEEVDRIEEKTVDDDNSDISDDVDVEIAEVTPETEETLEVDAVPVSEEESEEGLAADDMIFNMDETVTNEPPAFDENGSEKPILENEETNTEEAEEVEEPKTKSKKSLIIIAAIIVVIIGVVIAIISSSSDEGIQDIAGIEPEIEMMIGDEFAPEYAIEPSEYSDEDMTFTVSDEDVAVVDEDGVITAVGEGEAVMTISAGEYSEEVVIIVKEEEEAEDDSDSDNYAPASSKNKDKKNEAKETQATTETIVTEPTTEPAPDPEPAPAPDPETPVVEQPAGVAE